MPRFDECCVLIPAATLEDFPTGLSDYDARSLLAAWTVLWHPSLIADAQQIPTWYRADSPPDPVGKRLFTVPTPSVDQLPGGYAARAEATDGCCWAKGESREEMMAAMAVEDPPPVRKAGREVTVDDFFAAGFASLQIQVMTRRLRYTSNLDEIHLQSRVVAAAKSFLSGDAETTIDALHDVFDCLAEERDHYFSSDPHLIDLTLTSVSTIDALLDSVSNSQGESTESSNDDDDAPLPTPGNLLVDTEVAACLGESDDPRAAHLRAALASAKLGWAGGGPPEDVCLDTMTFAQAESVFRDVYDQTTRAMGAAPPVYGRFSGATPADITSVLVKLGYRGMIPLDFAGGGGHGDEAKVILQSAGAELHALTAKPIDAASDASFLTLGPRLGEAIDGGEIATALLVHWPGQTCDSLEDLRRVASWSLSLGRFWTLEEYFVHGEHPYHHGTAQSSSADAARILQRQVQSESKDPISSLANRFRDLVRGEHRAIIAGMSAMVSGVEATGEPSAEFAEAIGAATRIEGPPVDSSPGSSSSGSSSSGSSSSGDSPRDATLVVNPHSAGHRASVDVRGTGPKPAGHLFANIDDGGKRIAIIDVPACGFVVVPENEMAGGEGVSIGRRIRDRWLAKPAGIAADDRLRNEFMEVAISAESGGVAGVYSGTTRGNRFSMRLVCSQTFENGKEQETLMRCNDFQILSSTPARGCIATEGDIIDAADNSVLAKFRFRYTLACGSRTLKVEVEIDPASTLIDNPAEPVDPWKRYLAARVAVANEAAIYRTLVRDRIHRARSRRLVSPLGVLIDEADRQTLISAAGAPFFRRVGDRFLDALLWTQGESVHAMSMQIGFDVPSPLAAARAMIAPPTQVPIKASAKLAEIGWILHASPKDLLISQIDVDRRTDGRLAAIVRVIQTRTQSCKATVRFFRDVEAAFLLTGPHSDCLNLSLDAESEESSRNETTSTDGSAAEPSADTGESNAAAAAEPDLRKDTLAERLASEGDTVTVSIPSHGVAEMLVVFVSDAN